MPPTSTRTWTSECWQLGQLGAFQLGQPLHLPSSIPESLSPWKQVFGWEIIDASFPLIQKRTHVAHRSPPELVCHVCFPLIWLHIRVAERLLLWAPGPRKFIQMSFAFSSGPLSPPTTLTRGKVWSSYHQDLKRSQEATFFPSIFFLPPSRGPGSTVTAHSNLAHVSSP